MSRRGRIATEVASGRYSKATVELLVTAYLQDGERTALWCLLARLQRARDGVDSALATLTQPELTSRQRSLTEASLLLWRTQVTTLAGAGLAFAERSQSGRLFAEQMEAALSMLAPPVPNDDFDFTTSVLRAKDATLKALGDGK